MKEFDVLIPALKEADLNVPRFLLKKARIITSDVKGIARARNLMISVSDKSYLVFLDSDVNISKEVFDKWLVPAMKEKRIVAYEGNNPVLCSRVLGVPRDVIVEAGGFDESFSRGEDQELGYRLESMGYRWEKVPNDEIEHKKHRKRGGWFSAFKIEARFLLRYGKFQRSCFKRKSAPLGVLVFLGSLVYFFFKNKRRGLTFDFES